MFGECHRQDTVGVLGMDAFAVHGLRQLEAAAEALADKLAQMHFAFFFLLLSFCRVAHREDVMVYVDLQIFFLTTWNSEEQGVFLVGLLHVDGRHEVGVAASRQDIIRAEEGADEVVVEKARCVRAAGTIGYEGHGIGWVCVNVPLSEVLLTVGR